MDEQRTISQQIEDVKEEICNHYKSKSLFVEAVRCKDCEKNGLATCPICYIEKQALQFINHDPEFYCAYGERKGRKNEI